MVSASVTLQALSLSPATATVGTAYSGTITGKTSGSTITLGNTGAAGLSVSGSSVTGTPTTAGAVDLTETLAGATNSPRTTSGALTVASAAPVARTQNIASAMRVNGFSNGTSDASNTAFNTMSYRFNDSGAPVTSVQIVYPGWWTDTDANGAERDHTGNLTITAAVEIGGVRTQVLFSGAASGVVTPGANLVSDAVTLPSTLADGGQIIVHTHGEYASGVRIGGNLANAGAFATRDKGEYGVAGTLADKTMSGTNSGTLGTYAPAAILATGSAFRKVSLATSGDSISVGNGDGNYDAKNNIGWQGRAASGNAPLIHMGVTGTTAQASALSGKFARRADLVAKAGITHFGVLYATNDIGANRTLTQIQGDVTSIANTALAAVPGLKIFSNTILPRTTSTDGWQSITRQTISAIAGFSAGSGSLRAQYNAWLRTVPSPFFDYVELADVYDSDTTNAPTRNGGYWLTGSPTGDRNRLNQTYPGTVGSGATTTVIPTGVIKAANFFSSTFNGRIEFTSGALSGTLATIASSDASGNVTLSAAAASAPAAGDTFVLRTNRNAPTGDGTHPNVTDLNVPYGGYFGLRDAGIPKFQGWNQ